MILNRNTSIPLYVQIKSTLLSLIAEKQPDQRVPSESELSKEYNVSRGTVKQAITDLVHERILYRIQGKGTFVAHPKIKRSFGSLPTFTDDIRKLGCEPKSYTVSLVTTKASAVVCSHLSILPDSEVIRFERIVLANDKPFALVVSYLRNDIYPNLSVEDIGDSLYKALENKYGKVPVWANDTYMCINASSSLADTLNIKEGKALFYSERIAYLENDQPVEFCESYLCGDRFMLDITIASNAENKTITGNDNVSHFGLGLRNLKFPEKVSCRHP